MFELRVREKNFARLLMSLIAFGDLVGTQGIRRIKRCDHTMHETISMPPNVSRWRFFRFQSLSKPFSMDFKEKIAIFDKEICSKMIKNRTFGIKKCFQENVMFELGVRETNFYAPSDVSDGFRRLG